MSDIRTKRAYEKAANVDGQRILVDGMWPRGVSKEDLRLTDWIKEIAPSDELRKWFGHDPDRWEGFRARYGDELSDKPDAVERLRSCIREGRVTLVYAAKDEEHNNAVALKDWLPGE